MNWTIDPNHTSLTFSIGYFGLSLVTGSFRKLEGTAETDESGLITLIWLRIDSASIDTNQIHRDAALRSEHFFDSATHPWIVVERTQHGASIETMIELRGIRVPVSFATPTISLPMIDPEGKHRIGGSASAVIDRSAWGVSGNMSLPSGAPAIAMEVNVRLDAEAIESYVTKCPLSPYSSSRRAVRFVWPAQTNANLSRRLTNQACRRPGPDDSGSRGDRREWRGSGTIASRVGRLARVHNPQSTLAVRYGK